MFVANKVFGADAVGGGELRRADSGAGAMGRKIAQCCVVLFDFVAGQGCSLQTLLQVPKPNYLFAEQTPGAVQGHFHVGQVLFLLQIGGITYLTQFLYALGKNPIVYVVRCYNIFL